MIKHKLWRRWAKALGEKSGKDDKESDNIAVIRTIIFVTYLVTNCFIVAGVIRHWNDSGTNVYVCADKPRGGYWCGLREGVPVR